MGTVNVDEESIKTLKTMSVFLNLSMQRCAELAIKRLFTEQKVALTEAAAKALKRYDTCRAIHASIVARPKLNGQAHAPFVVTAPDGVRFKQNYIDVVRALVAARDQAADAPDE